MMMTTMMTMIMVKIPRGLESTRILTMMVMRVTM